MKKVFYIMIAAVAAASVSCVNEIEDIFDASASERLNVKLQECKELLTSQEYGWLIHYYPSSKREWGGCTYAAKFETDGNVTVAGEVALRLQMELGETVTSHYSIKSSDGPVLSFDTYNDLIHYWSDPDIPYANKKYDGDIEYSYVEGNENRLVFRGTKSGNTIVFTPLKEDIVTSVRQLESIYKYLNETQYYIYKFTDDAGETYDLIKTRGFHRLTLDGVDMPYAITPEGFTFYQPVTIGTATVSKMNWNGTALTSEDAVSADGSPVNFTVEGLRHERYQSIDNFTGKYKFTFTELSYYPEEARTEKTVEVSIFPNETRDSLVLRGLTWMPTLTYGYMDPGSPYDLKLAFDSFDGTLELHTQKIGTSGATNQHWVYFIPADHYTWTYWNWYSHNMELLHNNPADPDDMVLTFDYTDERGKMNAFWITRYLGPKEDNALRPTIGMIYGFEPLVKISE